MMTKLQKFHDAIVRELAVLLGRSEQEVSERISVYVHHSTNRLLVVDANVSSFTLGEPIDFKKLMEDVS